MLCFIEWIKKSREKSYRKNLALDLWVRILPLETCCKKRKTPLNYASVNVFSIKNRQKKTYICLVPCTML